MKRFLLTFVIVLNLCAFTNPTQIIIPIDDPYYWYNNTKIRLQLNPAETFILFSESAKLDPVVDSAIQRTVLGEGLEPYKTKPAKRNLIWARIKSSEILNIKTEDVIYKAPSFFNSYGEVVTLSNVFYVKLRRADDLAILDKMATKADIEIIGSDSPTSLWYMLSCTNKSDGSSLEMANKFFESGAFAASEPELLTGNQASCTNDPSFGSQWYLKNTGQNGGSAGSDIKACDAWTITKGCANVIVAVADEGVDPGHPDILNLLPGYDAESGGSPAQIKGIHGTHMAGIIGAAHNTTGISGVAPQCKIMPVSFPLNSTTPGYLSRRKQGIKWAAKEGSAWIINLSWNSEVSGLIDDAINLATTTGQGGLGCVVIVSSGNQSSVVKFPATRSDVLAVGATTNKDKRADFSNNGSGIDVVAPGVGIYTTDGVGIFGEGPGDYITKNGTSEAAAIVSGVAALILSTNPSLNQAQVRQIIESTTDKAGGYAYTLGSGENASQSWNIEMGYGRVNAFKAVQKARGVINGPDVFCSTASYSISGAPSGATTWSTDFPGYVSINAAGLAQRISDRVVTISANIATACGTKQLTKMVTAGSPSYTHITAESGYIGTGQRIIDLCALPVEAEAAYLGPGTISGYEWQIQAHPNWTINKKTANGKIVEINYWQSPANNPEKIYVRAKNTCGWGAYQETLWTIKNCFAAYTIYPNPAEKFINIDFDDVKSENSLPDRIELYKTTYDKLLKSVYPKALYNNHELISNKTISINVSEFERGNYVVHIIKGAETERRQIQLR